MNMILIFDLDDTLYGEMDYVQSGFLSVARFLENQYGFPASNLVSTMNDILQSEGRGYIFNQLLHVNGIYNKTLTRKCVSIYRHHSPNISLFKESKTFLESIEKPLYLLTDGHKIVQRKKINALKIERYFKKIYLTHQYGKIHSKPSVYCFHKIKLLEGCRWTDMVYIGDNPLKDFVNLKPLGVHTIRVLTGHYRNTMVEEKFNAKYAIPDLSHLNKTLLEIK